MCLTTHTAHTQYTHRNHAAINSSGCNAMSSWRVDWLQVTAFLSLHKKKKESKVLSSQQCCYEHNIFPVIMHAKCRTNAFKQMWCMRTFLMMFCSHSHTKSTMQTQHSGGGCTNTVSQTISFQRKTHLLLHLRKQYITKNECRNVASSTQKVFSAIKVITLPQNLSQ